MIVVSIERRPAEDQYDLQRKNWIAAENAEIRLPPSIEPGEAYLWIDFLLKRVGDGFADSLLSSLVELDFVTDESRLLQTLSLADKGARVSVCLKVGLSERLRSKCSADNDEDVRNHFTSRYEKS